MCATRDLSVAAEKARRRHPTQRVSHVSWGDAAHTFAVVDMSGGQCLVTRSEIERVTEAGPLPRT